MLRRLVNEHSKDDTIDWPRIALEVPKKTATQCRFRWINTIYPAIILGEEAGVQTVPTIPTIPTIPAIPMDKPTENEAYYRK